MLFPPHNVPITILCCLLFIQSSAVKHLPYKGNTTPTWENCIHVYDSLDRSSDIARLLTIGTTDIGKPLHLFVINYDRIFYPELFDRRKNILLINNAIHPGEPDGVNACMQLCSEILAESGAWKELLDSTIICIVPMYNVDGALNRSATSRANQNGPAEYGFRGNARNLDLNRDFIKCDSRNAQSFNQIFTRINPHVFVDTHVSNGADYAYTMTLISTQYDKLGGSAGEYLRQKMEPALFNAMKLRGHEMSPYVNTMGATPESGLVAFLESPRFATGYSTLFNAIGFTTETHMLKPFDERVESTYQFLCSLLDYMDQHTSEIQAIRKRADEEWKSRKSMFLEFEVDTTQRDLFRFRGFEATEKPSAVGTGNRLFYDRSSTWEKDVAWYKTFRGKNEIQIPVSYIIPQAWSEVVRRLQWNGVAMTPLAHDTIIEVEAYFIDDYKTSTSPYEGHYHHYNVAVRKETKKIQFFQGDWLISTNQRARRYLVTVLEPTGDDSFFAWNFFDSVLQQKEWFSDYVFEEKAEEILKNNPEIKKEFDAKMASDNDFKGSHWNQLYWIYKRSDYYEPSAYRYPVYRLNAASGRK